MHRLAVQGAALFLFIPLVLFLYLKMPLGAGLSTGLGLLFMFGHRFVASPWMARHSRERCLWCGRRSSATHPIPVRSSGRTVTLDACERGHAENAARFLTFVSRFRIWIGLGILGPLAVLLAGNVALAFGRSFVSPAINVFQFRTLVAITVMIASLGHHLASDPDASLTSPFPIHNLFLLGIRNTLWIFRIVGLWWLVLSVSFLSAHA